MLAPLPLLLLLGVAEGDRPADNPCVTWISGSWEGAANSSWDALDMFIPAIYSAWQWKPGGTPAHPSGRCIPCDGTKDSFECAYIFPCYSSGAGLNNWGHRDTIGRLSGMQSGCNTHLPSGNSSLSNGPLYFPGKGPQWEKFGWQVSQAGAQPSKGIGQLITDPSGRYVLARSPQASPFQGCGPGMVGWVNLTQGVLGCMEFDANVIPAQQCNGFEVAYCKVCAPCPHPYNGSFHPGPGCPDCPKPPPAPPPPPPPIAAIIAAIGFGCPSAPPPPNKPPIMPARSSRRSSSSSSSSSSQ